MCLKLFGYKLIRIDDENMPIPQGLEDIGYEEIYSILKAEFPKASIILADRDYKTVTKEELIRYLKYDLTDSYKYVPEYYDCDNFSYHLFGSISNPEWGSLPFAIVFTKTSNGNHAVNCFVDKERNVWMIEPQNDWIGTLPKNWEPYFILM